MIYTDWVSDNSLWYKFQILSENRGLFFESQFALFSQSAGLGTRYNPSVPVTQVIRNLRFD